LTKRITAKQRGLIKELDELYYYFHLDYADLVNELRGKSLSARLEVTKDKVIRAQIIIWYTLVDEHLNIKLCRYFFGGKADSIRLWKTKKFRLFNYHILEELSLMKKLAFVRALVKMPRQIVSDIERLNALRNGIAHAFFPQNLRRNAPIYKGKDIFSIEGLRLLRDDSERVLKYLQKIAPL
jgi:hypothetical protein